jgi:alkanesulfonate monooxygenase SsuD/methylene tetrahydromethanopterin reductase-like flavin-dependent oxidoreductase (luciferase family)
MRFSVALPTAYEGLGYPVGIVRDPASLLRLARTAERLGFDGLWANDHLVTPDFLRGESPHFYEAMVTLASVAAVTQRLRLGTVVLALPLREPVLLARQAATLAALSGDRFVLGLGLGAFPEELAAIRPEVSRRSRAALFAQTLAALRAHLGDARIPIYVGGHGTAAVSRAARDGDGWMPGWQPLDVLAERIALLRRELAACGRDAHAVAVAPELSATIAPRHEDAVRRYESSRFVRHRRARDTSGRDQSNMTASNLVGSPDAIREKIARLEALGVDECAALAFPAESVDDVEDQWTTFAALL